MCVRKRVYVCASGIRDTTGNWVRAISAAMCVHVWLFTNHSTTGAKIDTVVFDPFPT